MKKRVLKEYHMMNDSAQLLAQEIRASQKITVFTGAGISTSCGIPDFRGPGGIYKQAQERYDLPYPEALFDLEYFDENPIPFYDFSSDLFQGGLSPSFTHSFLAELEKTGQLQIIVTQNIDGLHERAGNTKVLGCHGNYLRGHCRNCGKEYPYSSFAGHLLQGTVMLCECTGVVKPDIVFFGENLPLEYYALSDHPPATDLLLVLGTGLEVQPAASFPLRILESHSPSSWIVNKTPTRYDARFTHRVSEDLDGFFTRVKGFL